MGGIYAWFVAYIKITVKMRKKYVSWQVQIQYDYEAVTEEQGVCEQKST